MAALQASFGPVKIIKVVKTTHSTAAEVELKMHHHFKAHCNVQPSGGGRTEWFDNYITEEATEMLSHLVI